MSIIAAFLIYLTLFRLTMIAAGVVSIILGYRLLRQGMLPSEGSRQGMAVDATIPGARFTLKNATPGTCFALFGVLLISVMVVKGSPELALEMLNTVGLVEGKGAPSRDTTRLTLRGNDDRSLHRLTQQGVEGEKRHDTNGAIAAYQEALTLMATPMNHLAWLYQQQGKASEGLPLARLAVQLRPDMATFLETLAVILCKTGEHAEALTFMEKARQMDPETFGPKLERLRSGACPG